MRSALSPSASTNVAQRYPPVPWASWSAPTVRSSDRSASSMIDRTCSRLRPSVVASDHPLVVPVVVVHDLPSVDTFERFFMTPRILFQNAGSHPSASGVVRLPASDRLCSVVWLGSVSLCLVILDRAGRRHTGHANATGSAAGDEVEEVVNLSRIHPHDVAAWESLALELGDKGASPLSSLLHQRDADFLRSRESNGEPEGEWLAGLRAIADYVIEDVQQFLARLKQRQHILPIPRARQLFLVPKTGHSHRHAVEQPRADVEAP